MRDRYFGGFRREPVLFLLRLGQHDDGPEQGDGGGFVAGEDQGGDLVAELGRGEGGAGFRVAGGAQQVEQVARVLRRRLVEARLQDRFYEVHPAALEPAGGRNRLG